MKMLEIVVPTYNRPLEIARFLESAQKVEVPVGWVVNTRVRYGGKPEALTGIVNGLVQESSADVVMVLADHLVMHSDCLINCMDYFNNDLDLMVGLRIENCPITPGVSEYCFFAVGKEFISRFPDRQIFCPDYWHFYADNELGRYANEIGKFIWAEDAKVTTYHPNVGNAEKDETYWASRKNIAQDKQINSIRKTKGLLWGRDLTLTTKGNNHGQEG